MARAAVLGRLNWLAAQVAAVRDETVTARTIALDVPGWPGHAPGQHVDVRLTAADGYSAQRSYSIASAPAPPGAEPSRIEPSRIELTVQRIMDGEISPYLTDSLVPGQPLELRGPIGGWFVWDPADPGPVLLAAGGSGIVPLMSMIRARRQAGSAAPFRLVYSVRTPADVIYADELAQEARAARAALSLAFVWTRQAPPGPGRPAGRITGPVLAADGWRARQAPAVYACGPTGFVEAAATLLTRAGHDPARIRTERFGPTG
jgi:ferredoxin-NADP reductase